VEVTVDGVLLRLRRGNCLVLANFAHLGSTVDRAAGEVLIATAAAVHLADGAVTLPWSGAAVLLVRE
jgi:hypothetical protein